MKKVSILGCGNGGMALAADLKLKGVAVALWSDSTHATKLECIQQNNKEVVLHEGDQTQTAQLDLVTTDLSAVVQFGEIIYICTPMAGHVALFHQITSLVKNCPSAKILINLSGVFSGIDQFLQTEDKTIFRSLKVFDSSTFPYACRAGDSNQVFIHGRKLLLPLAPLFKRDLHALAQIEDEVKPIPFLIVNDIFELGLMGNNAVLHPATVLINVNSIAQARPFQFYREGNSEQTTALHEAIDAERLLLATKMGYSLKTNVAMLNQLYGTDYTDHADLFKNFPVYAKVKGPTTLSHRFLAEDAAYSLVPLLALANLYEIELPNIQSIVRILSTLMGVDYLSIGRNLTGLSRDTIGALLKQPDALRAPTISIFADQPCSADADVAGSSRLSCEL